MHRYMLSYFVDSIEFSYYSPVYSIHTSMTSMVVSHPLPTTTTRSRSRPTATIVSACLSRSVVMHISSSEAMTNTDLSYLYGVVSALSSAMSVMLMAS